MYKPLYATIIMSLSPIYALALGLDISGGNTTVGTNAYCQISNCGLYHPTNSIPNCTSTTTVCLSQNGQIVGGFNSCQQCTHGYKLQTTSGMVSNCAQSLTYNSCTCDNNSCTNCTSSDWETILEGSTITYYQKRIERRCSCGNCISTTKYRCAGGAYQSGTILINAFGDISGATNAQHPTLKKMVEYLLDIPPTAQPISHNVINH